MAKTTTTTTTRCQGCKASCNPRYLDQAGYCAKSGCQKKSKGDTPPTSPAPKATLDAQHVGTVEYSPEQKEAQQLRARCRELGVSDGGTVDVLRKRLSGSMPQAKPSKPVPTPAPSQGSVNQPTTAPTPQQGKVTEPVQGPQGTAQCYTHQQTAAGLVYAVATTGQLVEALMARCNTAEELDAVLDMLAKAAEQREEQVTAPQAPAAKPAPAPQQTPAPAPKPTPAPAPQKTAAKDTPPAKPARLPATYKQLMGLGGDGVKGLAKRLNVSTDGKWADLCSRVWTAVQAAQQKGLPAPKTTVDAKRTTDPIVPGCFGADGKPLTLSQVMAAVAKVQPVK